jgi:hypothetical protein
MRPAGPDKGNETESWINLKAGSGEKKSVAPGLKHQVAFSVRSQNQTRTRKQ